jgi:ubiquitin carboxyl-terminal hydrolase 7
VAEECDWGFTRFVDLRKLYSPDPASGKHKATIDNDEVEITAFVRVLKDPTGVLWHNFVKCVHFSRQKAVPPDVRDNTDGA